MAEKYNIRPEQGQALKDIEKLIGKKIPQVEKLTIDRNPQNNQWGLDKYGHTFGVTIEGNRIIGLALHDCGLKKIPESIGNLTSLKILSLRNNKLTTLPNSFRNLDSLEMLSLWRNNLSTIPEPLTALSSLQELLLQYNQLSMLTDTITNLSSLRYLNLGGNNLTSLPKTIENLKSLQKLIVWDNHLTLLPDTICNSFWMLKSLTSLDLSENPWEEDWQGIENDTTQRVIEICRKRAPITIFIIHSQNESEKSYVYHLMQNLKKCKEIQEIYLQDHQNIVESHLVLFIATLNSIIDEKCKSELKFAISKNIPIIPLKTTNIQWKDLSKINLGAEFNISEKLGFELEFEGNGGKDFYIKLYEYIRKYKREINLLEPEEGKLDKQQLNAKIIVEKFVESEEFIDGFEKNVDEFKNLARKLQTGQISIKSYLLKTGELLKPN
ncbi:MAG: hypothetical protein P8Y70_14580 [Candidatus Lokiarchaeota archaeon]